MKFFKLLVVSNVALLCALASADFVYETQTARLTIRPTDSVNTLIGISDGFNFTRPYNFLLADGVYSNKATSQTPSCTSGACTPILFSFPKWNISLAIIAKESHFTFQVLSVTSEHYTLPATIYIPYLKLTGFAKTSSGMSGISFDSEHGIALRSLDKTPKYSSFGAGSYGIMKNTTGFVTGTKFMLVASAFSQLRPMMQKAFQSEDVLWSKHGGPFALDSARARDSYIFSTPTEKNIQSWIDLALEAGIGIVHFSVAYQSLGHYYPHNSYFPNGTIGLKNVLDKIHNAGLLAGLHTLSGAISTGDSYIRPVPDHRMAVDAKFTLTSSVTSTSTTFYTSTPPLSTFDTVWTYNGRANVLRIDNELIQYAGMLISGPPYGFINLTRGAFGTTASAHASGSIVNHMFVRYSTFQADDNSTLVDDIAANIGALHGLGFDFIYHDGAEGMPDGSIGEAIMRNAIFKAMTRETSVEASDWGSFAWPFHSRVGAWDVPWWGIKACVDIHVRENNKYAAALLPTQLGWFSIFGQQTHAYAQLPDEFEYLCTKSLANDMAITLQSVSPSTNPSNPRQSDFLAILKNFEKLRRGNILSSSVIEQLKTERAEFHIIGSTSTDDWKLVPVSYPSTVITGNTGGNGIIYNVYRSQAMSLRIQNLFSVEQYSSANGLTLASFNSVYEFSQISSATGVSLSFSISTAQCATGTSTSGVLTIKNNRTTRIGSWTYISKTLPYITNIKDKASFGLWVYGDGKGEIINIQPKATSTYSSALDEHYIFVNFTGWKYFELLLMERNAEEWRDYAFPYTALRDVYIVTNDWAHISYLNIFVNNIPPGGCTVYLSPIKALPVVSTKLSGIIITLNSGTLSFPLAEISSGEYIEFNQNVPLKIVKKSSVLSNLTSSGIIPTLNSGSNTIQIMFTTNMPDVTARVKLTLMTCGNAIASGKDAKTDSDGSQTKGITSFGIQQNVSPIPFISLILTIIIHLTI